MAAMKVAVGWATVIVSEVSGSFGVGGGEGGGESGGEVLAPSSRGFNKPNNQLDRSYANPSPRYNIQRRQQ